MFDVCVIITGRFPSSLSSSLLSIDYRERESREYSVNLQLIPTLPHHLDPPPTSPSPSYMLGAAPSRQRQHSHHHHHRTVNSFRHRTITLMPAIKTTRPLRSCVLLLSLLLLLPRSVTISNLPSFPVVLSLVVPSHTSTTTTTTTTTDRHTKRRLYFHWNDSIHHSRHTYYQFMNRSTRLSQMSSSSARGSTSKSQSDGASYMQVLSNAVSEALGRTVELEMTTTSGGSAGGSGATTLVVQEKQMMSSITSSSPERQQSPSTTSKYFVKSSSNHRANQQMMYGEYCSVQALHQTRTIRVPKPIAYGKDEIRARTFVIFEYLTFAPSPPSQYRLGQQLAQLHLESIPTNPQPHQYGFHVNNTIGATLQPNLPYFDHWTDFYIHHRLDHMLQLTNQVGMSNDDIEALRIKVRNVLQQHTTVQPSLVHGDLWGGNKGFCYDNNDIDNASAGANEKPSQSQPRVIVPCIFDPASYYGDREVDIAMTYVFGGFTADFYQGYDSIFPLAMGHESRRIIYNLYHILNHDVLFGGSGYRNQARNMIYEILRM